MVGAQGVERYPSEVRFDVPHEVATNAGRLPGEASVKDRRVSPFATGPDLDNRSWYGHRGGHRFACGSLRREVRKILRMEPTDALRSIEIALRLLIVDVLGEAWTSSTGAPEQQRLENRKAEEERRRDGTEVSSSLIDYTELFHLTSLIEKNWERFQPALRDKGRTSAFFGVVEDVRNSVAHSRELVGFERDLLSGIAGQLRNQISVYRSSRSEAGRYYPLIESVTDDFGRQGQRDRDGRLERNGRLEVGDVLRFRGAATSARGKSVQWQVVPKVDQPFYPHDDRAIDVGEGEDVEFEYIVTEDDVHETFAIQVRIIADSRYHRYTGFGAPFDDSRAYLYSVNPPEDA